MNDFIFHNTTKVYFGREQFCHLPEELAQWGKRVLLVYGGGSIKKNGLYDWLMPLLADFTVFEMAGVEPNPRHTTVNIGAALCRTEDIDVILAVGGGSTIDCSKGIAATALSDTDDVWDLIEGKVPVKAALPIVTVLTIAATGSEMDASGVITNWPRHLKCSLRSPLLQPKATFENPEVTYSLPAYQTACGAVDIMAHIFDATYFTAQSQMDMLLRMQEEVLTTVLHFAPIALASPRDYEARANLMWASSWALNGMLFSGVKQQGACHVMEHELSAYYDITHGHGLAIIIPRWLHYILDEITAPAIYRFGRRCFDVIEEGLEPMVGAKQSIAALSYFFYKTLGLESNLSALGIDRIHFEDMAAHATEKGPINSMKQLTKDDVVAIYEKCL